MGLAPDDFRYRRGLLFGVAFGNLFLGLPFHFDALERPVFTSNFLSLLHPFALLAGVVSLA
jgi:cytochrome d ubiquinol oxidase subunit II